MSRYKFRRTTECTELGYILYRVLYFRAQKATLGPMPISVFI